MARVTVDDCLDQVGGNRFALVNLAARRAHQLKRDPEYFESLGTKNKEIVTALKEIAAGKVKIKE